MSEHAYSQQHNQAAHPSYLYAVQVKGCPSLVMFISSFRFQEGKMEMHIIKEGQAFTLNSVQVGRLRHCSYDCVVQVNWWRQKGYIMHRKLTALPVCCTPSASTSAPAQHNHHYSQHLPGSPHAILSMSDKTDKGSSLVLGWEGGLGEGGWGDRMLQQGEGLRSAVRASAGKEHKRKAGGHQLTSRPANLSLHRALHELGSKQVTIA